MCGPLSAKPPPKASFSVMGQNAELRAHSTSSGRSRMIALKDERPVVFLPWLPGALSGTVCLALFFLLPGLLLAVLNPTPDSVVELPFAGTLLGELPN